MDEQFIRDRLTELRIKKNISEYKMSLELGHSKNYIQNIVAGRTLPSITEFLYICNYLEITPKDFFNTDIKNPILVQKVLDGINDMKDNDLLMLLSIIDRLNSNNEST